MMAYEFLETASTPSVRTVQAEMGSEAHWRTLKSDRPSHRFTPHEAAFIAMRDSFYMASVSETGWPYVQHRGGPAGFLKVLDDTTLAFADYRGNRQYISVGNLAAESRTMLFLMDYPRRTRLKIFGWAKAVALDADPDLTRRVIDPSYGAKIERILLVRLKAYDWNCPQHILPRFTEAEIAEALQPLRDRVEALEAENVRLRAQIEYRTVK